MTAMGRFPLQARFTPGLHHPEARGGGREVRKHSLIPKYAITIGNNLVEVCGEVNA